MKKVCFYIDEKPRCIWAPDPHERNIELLEETDPTYFEYLAKVHLERLGGDDELAAALCLRTTYSHGLETLFAFLGAMIQSPHCVYGWLGLYKPSDLPSIVSKISQGQDIKAIWKDKPITWENISKVIYSELSLEDAIKKEEITKCFGELWRRFANDFLEETSRQEYNCIKHGLRAKSGGFQFAFNNIAFAGSKFGSRFFAIEKIKNDKLNFSCRRKGMNWAPNKIAERINFISVSLSNIVGYLKLICGDIKNQVIMKYPDDMSAFHTIWDDGIRAKSIGIDYMLKEEDIHLVTKDEILKEYQKYSY